MEGGEGEGEFVAFFDLFVGLMWISHRYVDDVIKENKIECNYRPHGILVAGSLSLSLFHTHTLSLHLNILPSVVYVAPLSLRPRFGT